jgi:hypothetical protein
MWSGLIRKWVPARSAYRVLLVRIEEAPEPLCLLRLYEDDSVLAEVRAETPQLALARILEIARGLLGDPSLDEKSIDWAQV